jgi:hypothetical protein
MRRFVMLAILLAACAPHGEDDVSPGHPDPDAAETGCVGAFQIVAPVADLHYAATMDVVIDSSEIDTYYQMNLTMVDDVGNSYAPTDHASGANPTDAGSWWAQDKWRYQLQPSHRYTLTVTHCDLTYQTESVTFFTSAM